MKWCWLGKHKSNIVAVNNGYGTSRSNLTGDVTGTNVPMTTILHKCPNCGKTWSTIIEGQWTLVQLQPRGN